MVVDKKIIKVALKPQIRGVYFYLAQKANFLNYCYFPYKEAKKLFNEKLYSKYISNLEMLSLISKEYKYFKTKDGKIARRNKIHLIIDEPVEIPKDVIQLVEEKNLNLKEKGIYYTLYLMANDYGEISSLISELSAYFDISYQYFSAYLRILENFDLIKREKGLITVNAISNVFI